MATSEWLRELRQAAGAGTTPTPTDAISRPRDDDRPRDSAAAPTAPLQAAESATGTTGNPSTGTAQATQQNVPQRTRQAFTAPTDATRDYRAMYAALFRFHERHTPPPPQTDDDGARYWTGVSDEIQLIAQQFNDDPFMIKLLCVVFEELESEYKAMQQQAAGA